MIVRSQKRVPQKDSLCILQISLGASARRRERLRSISNECLGVSEDALHFWHVALIRGSKYIDNIGQGFKESVVLNQRAHELSPWWS